MDLLRAVIVGAYGTPYQDGLFFFDFHLPPEYPDVPPVCKTDDGIQNDWSHYKEEILTLLKQIFMHLSEFEDKCSFLF